MRIFILALISASVAGFAGVKLAEGKRGEGVSGKFRTEDRRETRVKRWRPGDLSSWASNRKSLDPFEGEWKDWSDEELKKALDEGIADPEVVRELGDSRRIVQAIFGELVRRNPDEAIRWLESLQSESMRSSFSGTLAMNWPEDRAADGLAYVIAHRSDFMSRRSIAYGRIVTLAINDAAKLGPDAVAELFSVFRENRMDPRYSRDWEFPPGFDFAKLMEHPETQSLKASFFAGIWMSRDPEEAFQKLVADRDLRDVPARDFFNDLIPADDAGKLQTGVDRARWLSEKLAEFPMEKRWTVSRSIAQSLGDPMMSGSFVAGVEDEELRTQMVADKLENIMKYSWGTGMTQVLQFVEAAGENDWSIDALESLKMPEPNRGWFINEDEEKLIRQKLTEWNASPDRTETIVNRLKRK